ncbi:Perilipin-1 [Ooceraea biroi]|uniref:Perilipin-1 n=1 Tax=Ooceraea biroi TaxID=2015173 RepID=A0A026W5B3_OOCBI|nr:Perilipin-1 [Ooceraea biroi]
MPFVPQQSSVMCGTHGPTRAASANVANGNAGAYEMVCVRRLSGLPVFVSVSSTFRNGYTAVRDSHESVASIFGHVEDGMRAGLSFVSPINDKIASALKEPLKAVDNVVCVGLDFVEEKVPSVKLPPHQIYTNVKDSIRNIFTSALDILTLLFGGQKDQIKDAPVASETAKEEVRKAASGMAKM